MSRAADRPDGADLGGAAAGEPEPSGTPRRWPSWRRSWPASSGEAVDVDHLAERVQRAAALIRLCRSRLASARIEIETVLTDLERATDEDSS